MTVETGSDINPSSFLAAWPMLRWRLSILWQGRQMTGDDRITGLAVDASLEIIHRLSLGVKIHVIDQRGGRHICWRGSYDLGNDWLDKADALENDDDAGGGRFFWQLYEDR